MSLPVSLTSLSLPNADRLGAPPRVSDPTAANPGTQKPAIARATGGELPTDRAAPVLTVKQALQSENTRKTLPAGPPPAFEETLLERQARIALEFPPLDPEAEDADAENPARAPDATESKPAKSPKVRAAEDGFAETRAIERREEPASLDLRG